MSIQAVAWVLEQSETKGLQRLTLISLANHSDENGESWPSHQRIASEAATSVQQVRRVLAALEEAGLIERLTNAAPDARMRADRRTNLYRIVGYGRPQEGHPTPERVAPQRPTGSPSAPARVASEGGPNHQLEPSVEPTTKTSGTSGAVERIFAAFQEATGKTRARLTDDRRGRIVRWLRVYSEEELTEAARGWRWSPHHCGQNERGTVYNDLELLLRDAKHIEQFRDWERGIDRPAPKQQQSARMARSDNNRSRLLNLLPDPAAPERDALP